MSDDKSTLNALMRIQTQLGEINANVAAQAMQMENFSKDLDEIKQEQVRQNAIVTEHERRSTASEGRLKVLEDEHELFKTRITVAEKPALVINNIWRALITLGSGAAAMYGILKFFDLLK